MASLSIARATTAAAVVPRAASSAKPSGTRPAASPIAKGARVQRAAFDKSFLSGNAAQLSAAATTIKASSPQRRTVVVRAADGASIVPEDDDKKFLGVKMSTFQKVIPLGFMFFCILFNYTILRDTKDVLVVTAPGSGAEIIPFLKTWLNLPLAFGFMWLYSKLSNVMGPQRLFYTIIFPFLAFFGAFAFIMYPARDFLHPTEFCVDLLEKLGPKFMRPLAILRNWTYCAFYVAAELWGSVVVSVLFWGFANQIMEVKEAKQFYPLFGLIANVALIFSGQAVRLFSAIRADLPPGVDGWGISLK